MALRLSWIAAALACMLAFAPDASAQGIPSRFFKDGDLINWNKTDTSMIPNLDSLLLRNTLIQRLLDSIAGVDQRDIEHTIYGARNFIEGTFDTLWLQAGNNTAIYTTPLTLTQSIDRFIIQTRWSGGNESAYGPSSIGTGLPPVSSDSTLVYAIARLPVTPNGQYKFIVFKRANSTGFDFTAISGGSNVFVAEAIIDNTNFPDSTTNAAVFINGRMRIKFP